MGLHMREGVPMCFSMCGYGVACEGGSLVLSYCKTIVCSYSDVLSHPCSKSYSCFVLQIYPRYTFSWLVKPMWLIIKFLHRAADLTLVPSAAIARDLQAARVTAANRIRLWNKGVDSESFHPRYYSHEMRLRLSNGEPEKPLVIHVGRLGVEKSLDS
ncbi:Sulfoquinovosyl transferase SQD2 [Vitis vinifera]|uniref:Sulfoquinovosyl transferase SQD2 n=1 Tax=Vitis vinifera TaxID=29760 RepID=A0A438JAY3_VITVI|nr:Sulfoquinovosyl transferase SQD2 [Vitis vinifera]